MDAIDRRSARTRQALVGALAGLVRRKRYDAVTVRDIVGAAAIGHSTFYAHFTGKDDLLRECFRMLRRRLAAMDADRRHDPDGLAFSPAVFAHAAGHRAIYRALAGGPGGRIAAEEITGIISDRLRRYPLRLAGGGRLPRDMQQRYVLSTFLAVLTWWLEQDPDLPPQDGDRTFRILVEEGLAPIRPPAAMSA